MLTISALADGAFVPVSPDERGHIRSTVLSDLLVDPRDLFAYLL